MTDLNPKVDKFMERNEKWRTEFEKLREILLECDVTEDLKWGAPCYTSNKKNIVLMHGFNDYCALLFHKGALLKDEAGILIRQTENVQAARQMRFTTVEDIEKVSEHIKAYTEEAIEVEKAGLKVEKNPEITLPEELVEQLEANPALKEAFEGLTPGRKRAYALHISQAKRSETRTARVEKYKQQILDGKGMND